MTFTTSSHRTRTVGVWSAAIVALLALALLPGVALAGMQPLSSGVGVESRQPHPDYPLKLVFALSSGPYLANVDVVIHDSAGKEVAKLHSTGPWLFVDLPAGDYKVIAKRQDGQLATAMLHLGGGQQQVLTMTWNSKS
jgi:hypothetical protein